MPAGPGTPIRTGASMPRSRSFSSQDEEDIRIETELSDDERRHTPALDILAFLLQNVPTFRLGHVRMTIWMSTDANGRNTRPLELPGADQRRAVNEGAPPTPANHRQ